MEKITTYAYLVKQHYDDGLPYSEWSGDHNIIVCDTEETAKQLCIENDKVTIINPEFESDIWDEWLFYRDKNYSDKNDDCYCIFDNDEEIESGRVNELNAAFNYFKSKYTDFTEDELKEKIKKQWVYEDNRYYQNYPSTFEKIKFVYTNDKTANWEGCSDSFKHALLTLYNEELKHPEILEDCDGNQREFPNYMVFLIEEFIDKMNLILNNNGTK